MPPLSNNRTLVVSTIAVLLGMAQDVHADAIVVTRAMSASTICEIFVDYDSVRVDLEIGLVDLPAFKNLLPDGIHQALGFDAELLEERLPRFFEHDFTIRRPSGASLPGRVLSMIARPRLIRDEITGEPTGVSVDSSQVTVFARLGYALVGKPRALTVTPPDPDSGVRAAEIGFLLYHLGIPVNDFRYLGSTETVQLDWRDPWYSRFDNRNLWRKFDAPISAFLYVEPYEVRKEIVLRPRDLERWVDLEIDRQGVISVAEQEELKRKVIEFLAGKNPVTIDGEPATGYVDRIHFIRRTLRRTGVIDPPVDLPVNNATLGIIEVFPIDGLPENVSMEWELFDPRIERVPAVATDEAGGLPFYLTADQPVLTWQNFLIDPTVPTLIAVERPRDRGLLPLLLTMVLVALLLAVLVKSGREFVRGRKPSRAIWVAAGFLIVMVAFSVPRAV